MADRVFVMDIGKDLKVAVSALQQGPLLVADKDITARLSSVTKSIEIVAREALGAAKKAVPDKATVEVSFGLAVEEGELLALIGKGKAESSITVTLEWSRGEGT